MSDATARAFTRVPVGLHAEVESEDGRIAHGRIHDISLSGIGIDTLAVLPPDIPCMIRVRLETGTRPIEVRARGVVLRSGGGILAAQITTVDADGFEHLQKLVMYNSQNAGEVEREIEAHADEHPTLAPLGGLTT